MWRSNERARLGAPMAAWLGFDMVASASRPPAWAVCNWRFEPHECLHGDGAIKLGVRKGKVVVDEVMGDKVVKRQVWSKDQVQQSIGRAEEQCKRDKSSCEKTRKWRGELSRKLEVLEKGQNPVTK